jgi:hypothetical protein
MRITLRRTGETYYRVSTDGAPLLVDIGPCRVAQLERPQVLLEVQNEAGAAQTYRRLFGIDRTLQAALAAEEAKVGNGAALVPLIQPPTHLPSGPCVGAVLIDGTRFYRADTGAKPSACGAGEAAVGARCRALLDVVGLKRKPGEPLWHFDAVVSQVLLEAAPGPGKKECPFAEETPALESTMHDEESEYVVPDLEGA